MRLRRGCGARRGAVCGQLRSTPSGPIQSDQHFTKSLPDQRFTRFLLQNPGEHPSPWPTLCPAAMTSCKGMHASTQAPLQSRQRALLATPLPPPPPHHPRRCRRCRDARLQPCTAGLYSLPPDLASSLQTGCGIAVMLGLGFSALPVLTGDSAECNRRRYLTPTPDEGADNVRWSVMGLLSLLPFVNPMVRGQLGVCRRVFFLG